MFNWFCPRFLEPCVGYGSVTLCVNENRQSKNRRQCKAQQYTETGADLLVATVSPTESTTTGCTPPVHSLDKKTSDSIRIMVRIYFFRSRVVLWNYATNAVCVVYAPNAWVGQDQVGHWHTEVPVVGLCTGLNIPWWPQQSNISNS